MLIRNLSYFVFAGLLAGTALTGCGHPVSGPTNGSEPPTTSSSELPTTFPGGINVTHSSDAPVVGLAATAGEKSAEKFISDISSGNLAAAKAQLKAVEGDPVGQMAAQVTAHGSITVLAFTEFNPRDEMQDLYATLTFADKHTSNWVITMQAEDWPSSFKAPDPKREQSIYASGKWHVRMVSG